MNSDENEEIMEMKKSKLLVCGFMMGLTLIFGACAQDTPISDAEVASEVDMEGEAVVSKVSKQTADKDAVDVEDLVENWGVWDSDYMFNDEYYEQLVRIKFPHLVGIGCGTGKVAYQKDDSLVIWDGQLGYDSPAVEGGVENVLETYMEQLLYIMEDYRNEYHYDTFVFEIQNKELVTINEYEMCKYTGVHTYNWEGEPQSNAFVAYATQLVDGAYTYWMVIDESEDQSLVETIDEYATNMAYTMREIDY